MRVCFLSREVCDIFSSSYFWEQHLIWKADFFFSYILQRSHWNNPDHEVFSILCFKKKSPGISIIYLKRHRVFRSKFRPLNRTALITSVKSHGYWFGAAQAPILKDFDFRWWTWVSRDDDSMPSLNSALIKINGSLHYSWFVSILCIQCAVYTKQWLIKISAN